MLTLMAKIRERGEKIERNERKKIGQKIYQKREICVTRRRGIRAVVTHTYMHKIYTRKRVSHGHISKVKVRV